MFFALEHVYWAAGGHALIAPASAAERADAARQLARHPVAYVASWALLCALFIFMAFFPAVLVWPARWGHRQALQWAAVALGYAGIGAFMVYNVASGETGGAVICVVVALLGPIIARRRPASTATSSWLVLVATWVFGGLMTAYGLTYVVAALFQLGSDRFLRYLVIGGVNWAVGGILFLAAAWLTVRGAKAARGDPRP